MKIETEITGSLVKKVSMLSGDQKPGIELPPQEVTDTKTCENKITESKLHGGEITPGSKISKVQNDGVKSPGSNIVGGHNSEGSTSEGNNPGDRPPGSQGSNAGGTNGPVRESDQRGEVKIKMDVDSVPSTSAKESTDSFTQEAGCSKNEGNAPSVVSKGETSGIVEATADNNPAVTERKATLFTEGNCRYIVQ